MKRNKEEEIPIWLNLQQHSSESEGDLGTGEITCPMCKNSYVHCGPVREDGSNDTYGVAWSGRGGAVIIEMWCEQGHAWEFGLGFHKGNTFAFIRGLRDCPPDANLISPNEISSHQRFLDQFPANRRGVIGNYFYHAIRELKTMDDPLHDMDRILHHLKDHLWAKQQQPWCDDENWRELDAVMNCLFTDDAKSFVQYVIWRESLSAAQRHAVKAEIAQPYITATMAGKPATEKQIALLRKLGYDGEITDRAAASKEIDARLKK